MIYPKELPLPSVQAILDSVLTGNDVDHKVVVAHGYTLLGYFLGQTVGEPLTGMVPLSHLNVNPVQLQALFNNSENWVIIFKHLLALITELSKVKPT